MKVAGKGKLLKSMINAGMGNFFLFSVNNEIKSLRSGILKRTESSLSLCPTTVFPE